jgi:hypothetical protein
MGFEKCTGSHPKGIGETRFQTKVIHKTRKGRIPGIPVQIRSNQKDVLAESHPA